MTSQYLIAQNLIAVSAPAEHKTWKRIQSRFQPFSLSTTEKPVLEINISTGPLPACNAEVIYEPDEVVAGFITARALRKSDGTLVMQFRDIAESIFRLQMIMPPTLDRAEIIMVSETDPRDPYFLAHSLMIAYMIATADNGTLLIHSATVIHEGKAYLFQGKSGTGKSTHASLWTKNIEGAELLNDDNPVIRFTPEGVPTVYGSPWSGKTHCYRNLYAPIGAFVRIVRDEENRLQSLTPLRAYASLTTSVLFLPFLGKTLHDIRHSTIERLVGTVP